MPFSLATATSANNTNTRHLPLLRALRRYMGRCPIPHSSGTPNVSADQLGAALVLPVGGLHCGALQVLGFLPSSNALAPRRGAARHQVLHH